LPEERDRPDKSGREQEPAFERLPGRKPHVCFVSPTGWPVFSGAKDIPVVGGAEVQQGFIARALVQRGFRVSLISLDYGQAEPSVVDGITCFKAHRPYAGIPVVRFVHPRMTFMWNAMRRVNADVYYNRSASVTTALMALFCRHHGKRSIYAGASDMDFIPGQEEIQLARDKWIFEFGLKRIDSVVVQNAGQLENFRRHYGRDATYIPSTHVPRPGARADHRGYVLWVARMGPSKRPLLAIEIAKRLPQYRFVIVGGPEGGREGAALYRSVIELAKQAPNVEMTGFVPYTEVDRYFNGGRVLLNTSEFEGFPNTFLQAWARGIPSVSLLDSGSVEQGMPVSALAKDVDEAAAQVDRLMRDDIAWQQASQRSLVHFHRVHSVESMASRYEHLLMTLAGAK
jgi:glycosyltransferase involved in cell wall biosynthesis